MEQIDYIENKGGGHASIDDILDEGNAAGEFDPKGYDTHNLWKGQNLPKEYKSCNIKELLTERCITDVEKQRVNDEYIEFEKRGLVPVLKFLNYFVETLRKNNIVWGVGRGSSVASYCLYLLGVHKIDSIKYNLDMEEFLKWEKLEQHEVEF